MAKGERNPNVTQPWAGIGPAARQRFTLWCTSMLMLLVVFVISRLFL
jgi:hypothetical protein